MARARTASTAEKPDTTEPVDAPPAARSPAVDALDVLLARARADGVHFLAALEALASDVRAELSPKLPGSDSSS